MDVSIRLRRQDREDESYTYRYEESVAQQRAEYEAEFGPEFRAEHPFKANGHVAHEYAMKHLDELAEYDL